MLNDSGKWNITPFEVKLSVKFNITTLRGIWTWRYAIFVGEEFEEVERILEDHSFNVNNTTLKFNQIIIQLEKRRIFENLSFINFRWNTFD